MPSSIDIGIFTTDATLVVRTWDPWIAAVTGIQRDDAVGRLVVDLLPELEERGFVQRMQEAATTGAVQVLSPALHHYLIRCPPRTPSTRFEHMQQRVTIGPLHNADDIVGVVVAIEDVTARLEAERELAEAYAAAPDEGLPAALASDDWKVRQAAVERLAAAADQQFFVSLIAMLRDDHRNFALLSSAVKLLAATNVDVTQALAALLNDRDRDLRIQAALALGEQAHADAVPPLVDALSDSDTNVRFQAIESLGRLRATSAVDALAAIVESRDYFLAFAALDALAAIQEPRVASRLVPLLDEDELRVPVADALGVLGDDRVVAALVAALNTSAGGIVSVAGALARIHDRSEREFHDGDGIADLVRAAITPTARDRLVAAAANAHEGELPQLARVLSWLGGRETAEALAKLLATPSVRSVVIEALARHGEGVVDLLVAQLDSDDRDTRHAAIVALGRVSSRRATPALVNLLDGEPDLLIAAAGALARIGDRAAFEPLVSLLSHPDAGVRQSAIGALNSMGHPDLALRVERLLQDANPIMRESAVRIAGYFGFANTVDLLFDRVHDADENVRRVALEHLGYVDDQRVLPTLLGAVAEDTARARASAIRALARVDGEAALDALLRAIDDENGWVRYFAARSLAERNEPTAIPALIRRAHDDSAAHVRIAAIDALGMIGGRAAVAPLRTLTTDPQDEIASSALAALAKISEGEGLPELLHALRAVQPLRRIAAVRALAFQGGREAVDALEWTAAADPDAGVARAAIEALGTQAASPNTAGSQAIDALLRLLSDVSRRELAAGALAQLPPSRIAVLARGLRHPQAEVRSATVEALGRIQRQEASQLVIEALTDNAPKVREAAVVTLARIGARDLEPTFARLAANDSSKTVRRAATAALARLRD